MNTAPMNTIPMSTYTITVEVIVGGGLNPLLMMRMAGRRYRIRMGYYE